MYLFLFGGERRCIAENKGEKQEDGGEKKKKKKEKRKKKGPCLRNRQNTHLDSILTFQTIEKKSIASVPRENRVI